MHCSCHSDSSSLQEALSLVAKILWKTSFASATYQMPREIPHSVASFLSHRMFVIGCIATTAVLSVGARLA